MASRSTGRQSPGDASRWILAAVTGSSHVLRRPAQDVAGPGHGGQDPPARVPRRLAARAPRRHRRVPSLHTRARTAHVPFLVKRVVKPVVKAAALLDTIGASPLHARARAHARTHAHAHAHACDMILSTNTSRF